MCSVSFVWVAGAVIVLENARGKVSKRDALNRATSIWGEFAHPHEKEEEVKSFQLLPKKILVTS